VHSNTERDFIVKHTLFVLQYSVYYSEDFFYCQKLCKDNILQNFGSKYRIKFLCINFFISNLMPTVYNIWNRFLVKAETRANMTYSFRIKIK